MSVTKRDVEGHTRWHVTYPDYDGITLLLDDRAIRHRYRHEEFAYDPERLLDLIEAGELSALHTKGGDADSELVLTVDEELNVEEVPDLHPHPIEGGILTLNSELVVTDWSKYTRGCAYHDGEVKGERIELPHDRYRVTWYRNYAPNVDRPPSDGVHYWVTLQSGAEEDTTTFETLPGRRP